MKKTIALFRIFSLFTLSGNLYAKERRGVELVIEKKDGQQIKGELIAIKESSLLLMDSETGADVSVDVGNISTVKIVKKSKALKGAGIEFLTFGGIVFFVNISFRFLCVLT